MVAVVLSITLMVLDHDRRHLEQLRAGLSVITYPLQAIADLPLTLDRWLDEVFATRRTLQETNARLHQENLRLRARQMKLEALQAENLRLRNLLDSSLKLGDRVLAAELSAVDLDPYKHQVLIDKGSLSGVFNGQTIVDAEAVMGQVIHVNPFSATVLLITDPHHALPVQVLRNGLRSIALGTGRLDQLELPYLPNDADIQVGDLLVTSGLGGRYPAGYPVAEVVQVARQPGQPFAEVIARPRAHLDRAREVLLVWPTKPPEPEITPVPPATAGDAAGTGATAEVSP